MTSTNIDYAATYSEFPEHEMINSAPSYTKIREIKDQIKANTSSASSELGGGARDHLGLVLANGEYANITATPYVCLVHHGPLKISTLTAQREEICRREDHKALIQVFREVMDLQSSERHH